MLMDRHPVLLTVDSQPEGWLVINPLTGDPLDRYFLPQHSEETRTIVDIAQSICDEGSEVSLEEIRAVLEKGERIKKRMIFQGFPVQDSLCRYELRVHGSWHGDNATFHSDPHRITISSTPTATTREELRSIVPVVLGLKQTSAIIAKITDLTAKSEAQPFVQGHILEISGRRIKIFPENEAGIGLFLLPKSGGAAIQISSLLYNYPSRLVFTIPENVQNGEYKIQIKTRFSHGTRPLKEPHIAESRDYVRIDNGEFGKSQPASPE
jgi:hypothetical protein